MSTRRENVSIMLMSGAALLMASMSKCKTRHRRWWRTELYKKRNNAELMIDLKSQQLSGQYKNFCRMSPSDFENLLQKVGPHISKEDTYFRTAISAQDRLAVTLRFLATGDSYTSLQYTFRISKQSIALIVPQVCVALISELQGYIKLPTTPAAWKEVGNIFETRWNLPQCVGALDGKHIVLQAPMNSGTEYFNYKSSFSIVLFALVDGNCNFMFADVGCQGRISDGGVFQRSKLHSMMTANTLGLPVAEPLPGRSMHIPYFFAGDSAFALSENLMKPYPGDFAKGTPQRIFNYRLSRARRVVENAFGISSSVFRVLRKPMLLAPEKAELIVMAVILLHNYLRTHSPNLYTPAGMDHEENGVLIEGSWRDQGGDNMTSFLPLRHVPRRPRNYCQKIRDEIADYCMKEGFIEWQQKYA